jgi:very-short-patch-repair endonuclease
MPNQFARQLRRNATETERRLWRDLKMLKNEGRHFRRQVPIGKYVADFACHSCGLVVELDGGQHAESTNLAADRTRTIEVNSNGYRVMRFWNADVQENIDGIMDMIRNAAGLSTLHNFERWREATPTPSPSPQGGGE